MLNNIFLANSPIISLNGNPPLCCFDTHVAKIMCANIYDQNFERIIEHRVFSPGFLISSINLERGGSTLAILKLVHLCLKRVKENWWNSTREKFSTHRNRYGNKRICSISCAKNLPEWPVSTFLSGGSPLRKIYTSAGRYRQSV